MIVSGGAHGLVTQAHFQEWWGYGVFFLAAAICLIGFGLALVTDAIDPRYMPADGARSGNDADHVSAIEHIAQGSRSVAKTAGEIASAAASQGALAADLAQAGRDGADTMPPKATDSSANVLSTRAG